MDPIIRDSSKTTPFMVKADFIIHLMRLSTLENGLETDLMVKEDKYIPTIVGMKEFSRMERKMDKENILGQKVKFIKASLLMAIFMEKES